MLRVVRRKGTDATAMRKKYSKGKNSSKNMSSQTKIKLPSPSVGSGSSRLTISMSSDVDTQKSERLSRILNSSLMHPVVLLPDLRDVLAKRATFRLPRKQIQTTNDRIPFSRVNPGETGGSKLQLRRNATRACKRNESKSVSLPEAKVVVAPAKCKGKIKARKTLSTLKSSDEMSPLEPITACKYCGKAFRVAEFTFEHELFCSHNPAVNVAADIRDHVNQKVNFLNGLELKPVSENKKKNHEVQQVAPPCPSRLFRLERLRVVKLLRNNPIPFASSLGQKIIADSASAWCDSKSQTIQNYDQHCLELKSRSRQLPKWPTAVSKKMRFKDGDYVHVATFSRHQRITRNSEIILGLNKASWKNFNKCRKCSVCLNKLSDEEIAKMMNGNHNMSKLSAATIKKSDLCKSMVVRLIDITKSPTFLRFFPQFQRCNQRSS